MRALTALALLFFVSGCGPDDDAQSDGERASTESSATRRAQNDEQRYPDVVAVEVEGTGTTYAFAVTISSPYDSPERYADGWRITGPDGTVYGEHMLMHDHAAEQPFTRTQTGVEIPAGVTEVTVEGRDQQYGYGGTTQTVTLPPTSS